MKKLFFVLILSAASISVFAQEGEVYSSTGKPIKRDRRTEREKGFDPTRLIFGGGFIFGIGGGVTDIGITPVVGYKITERFSAGVGLGYEYLSVKDFFQISNPNNGGLETYPLKTSIYSGSVWARYLILDNIFVHVEPQGIYYTSSLPSYDVTQGVPAPLVKYKDDYFVPRLLLGGGIRQPVSDRTSLILTILYDVIRDERSPYNGLDIRFGINVGF